MHNIYKELPVTPLVSEFNIGPCVVRVSPKQHYRLYTVYGQRGVIIGKQASYPSVSDCLYYAEKASGSGLLPYSDGLDLIKQIKKFAKGAV